MDIKTILLTVLIAFIVIVGGCAILPQYNVYHQRLAGEAELARAQQNRQIAVQEAQAKLESAKLLAQAEVERARGVQQANAIISGGLKDNEAYLRYLWITEVAGKGVNKEVVYVPTETNIPLLEAGKR